MNAVWSVLSTSAQLASIYGLAVLAIVVAFRIANFADMTMDGSFTLGGATGASLLVHGFSPMVALLAGAGAGALAGLVTALLHTRIGVNKLLAGIITMTMLYSVNLRVMGRSNLPLLNEASIFTLLPTNNLQLLGSVAGILILAAALWGFLRTDLGYFLRAAGENPKVVIRKGFSAEIFLLISLALANGLAGLAGGLALPFTH